MGLCSGGRRIPFRPPSHSQVPLQNRYEALELKDQADDSQDEDLSGGLIRTSQSTRRITATGIKKERRVIVVGDSLLKGTKDLVFQLDPSHREVCCLPGAWVRDITKRLLGLIHPSDYSPLLAAQVGSNEVDEKSPRAIKKDFKALG